MKNQHFTKLGHARHVIVVSLMTTLCGGLPAAYGQLTAADIAALRERGRKEGWTFQVGESSATRVPLSQLCGAVEPADWRTKGLWDPGPKDLGTLPASFDWRTQNGSVPIREQDPCGAVGACWAFATVGPLEYNIQIKDGLGVDLSEQWLISCNNSGYSCAAGGWDAHAYFQATPGKCGHSGAVFEATYPYQNADGVCACTKATNHVYHISSWAYIGGSRYTNPSVDVLKRAILDHGPITVCVFAGASGSAFHAYRGGIFNACSGSSTDHDHMVVLVGWDDNQAGGVWFVRNSWGTDWGENGYMRILYNCSNIGYAASYINYPGANSLQVSPCYGFDSQGPLGGPFDPETMVYTLTNQGASPLFWEVLNTPSWLNLSTTWSALPAGGSTTVTATVSSAACSLGPGLYTGAIAFVNDSNLHTNSLPVSLTVGRQPLYDFTLDTEPRPKWTKEGEWDFGQPTGQGAGIYGFKDPSSGYTGTNVFGVNLSGDYAITNVPSPTHYLTTGPYDFRGYTRTMLQFQRWLNCRPAPFAANVTIDVSTNYPNHLVWATIWSNLGQFDSIYDAYWTLFQCDFPAWADNCRYVYVRWGYRVPDAVWCSGWNIDDIQFQGVHVPVITNQPVSRINDAGTTASFAVTAGGLGPLSYHWVKYGTNYLSDGGKISGATTATLTISNVLGADRGNYSVVITNVADGKVTSSSASLTVNDPLISAQPVGRTNTAGTTASFTVGAMGTEPLSYQWRKGGTNLGDRTDVVLTLTNVGRRDNGIYAVLVTNMLDSVLSSNATLLVRVPQRLGTPCLLSDGTCIILSGDADGGLLSTNDLANFDLYASTNLESWLLLTNSLSLTNGQLQLCDPGSTNLRQRFYRIVEH